MPVDLDLALRAGVDAFSRPITIYPLASRPGQPAYTARGVWRVRNVDVALQDGAVLSSDVLVLGVRLREFAVPPVKGDQVDVPLSGLAPALGLYWIDDTDDDGEGGSMWTLKLVEP